VLLTFEPKRGACGEVSDKDEGEEVSGPLLPFAAVVSFFKTLGEDACFMSLGVLGETKTGEEERETMQDGREPTG
jgi:hypothetical protein